MGIRGRSERKGISDRGNSVAQLESFVARVQQVLLSSMVEPGLGSGVRSCGERVGCVNEGEPDQPQGHKKALEGPKQARCSAQCAGAALLPPRLQERACGMQ